MSETDKPKMMEYQARANISTISVSETREVVFALRGEPGQEEYDLAIRLPAGAVGALMINLRLALEDLDKKVGDISVVAQPLNLTGAAAALPVMNLPAVVLTLDKLNVPAVIPSSAKAREIAAAFSECADIADRPQPPRRLS